MTCNELFEIALDICGLKSSEADLPTDTDDLKERAISLINVILAENSILDCRIKKSEHIVKKVNLMEDVLDMSDIVVYTVLPYGLAKLLMLNEDEGFADKLDKLYQNARENALRFGKATIGEIKEVY